VMPNQRTSGPGHALKKEKKRAKHGKTCHSKAAEGAGEQATEEGPCCIERQCSSSRKGGRLRSSRRMGWRGDWW